MFKKFLLSMLLLSSSISLCGLLGALEGAADVATLGTADAAVGGPYYDDGYYRDSYRRYAAKRPVIYDEYYSQDRTY